MSLWQGQTTSTVQWEMLGSVRLESHLSDGGFLPIPKETLEAPLPPPPVTLCLPLMGFHASVADSLTA